MSRTTRPNARQTPEMILQAQQHALLTAAERATQFDVSLLSEYARCAFVANLPEPYEGQAEADYDEFVQVTANAFQRAFENKHRAAHPVKT